ncbi:MAG: hypothetical protein AMXMBFR47_30280 [Planctomycetota bacterium]
MPILNAWFRNRPRSCRRCNSTDLEPIPPNSETAVPPMSLSWRCRECGSATTLRPSRVQCLIVLLISVGVLFVPFHLADRVPDAYRPLVLVVCLLIAGFQFLTMGRSALASLLERRDTSQ